FIAMVGEDNAGDAAELMTAAEARSSGETSGQAGAGDAIDQLVGRQVFVGTCAECHGPSGEGGIGTRLVGNNRAANQANVADAVRFGRGLMPGFHAELTAEQIDAVVAYVTDVLAAQ